MSYLVPILILFWLIVIGMVKARFRLAEDERLVVFRLGRPVDIRESRFVMLLPYLENGVKYDITDPLDAKLVADYQAQFDKRRER